LAFAAFRRIAMAAAQVPGTGRGSIADELVEPLALWVRGPGRLAELSDRAVAVVGARAATGYGAFVAEDFGYGLGAAGFTVVSGAALGIDGASHRGALAAEAPTIAVLAGGIDQTYPREHSGLLARIQRTGLLVSEYPPGTVPARHRFLVRNRLIAALGAGTVVVEASGRSGAQRTARDAAALGRPVLAVPGPITSAMSVGCHQLLRDQHAVLVTRVEEVIEAVGRIGIDLAAPPPAAPARATDGLDAEALRVHDALPARASRSTYRISVESGVPIAAVRAALPELERRGLIERTEGSWRRVSKRPP
jgi:DNA processing protein